MGKKEQSAARPTGIYLVPPPAREEGEVFYTETGSVFHTGWCQIVHRTWEYKGTSLLVARAEDVSNRRLCASCARSD